MDNTIQAITYTVARTRNPNLWIENDLIYKMMDKPEEQGGSRIQIPVRYAQHPVEYFIGAEESEASRQEWQTAAYYEWVTARAPMFYTLDDTIKNDGGRNAIISYVKSLMNNSDESFADQQVQHFLGTGTDATRRQFNSFQHCANDSANTLGTGTTLGTLDKNVVVDSDGNKVYGGTVIDIGGSSHGPTRGNLIRTIARVKNGLRKPTLCVMHDIVLGEIIANLASGSGALQRYVNTTKFDIGFIEWAVEGIPVYGSKHMPLYTGVAPYNVGTVDTNVIYFIDTKSTKVIVRSGVNMVLRPWAKLPKSEAWYAARVLAGNTVCDDPRSNAVMFSFEYNSTAE